MRILLATDGSDSSLGAASFLSRFSLTSGDEIIVLHVVSELPIANKETYYAMLRTIRQEIAPKILEATSGGLKGVKAKTTVRQMEGHPDEMVLKTAGEVRADLIVMGSRGIRGRWSATVGSVTRTVAIGSPKPVLVVKPEQWEGKRPLKILYAVDGSEASLAAGRTLAALPLPADTAVTVLHVSPSGYMDIPERLHLEVNDRIKDIVAKMKETEFTRSEELVNAARSIVAETFPAAVEIAEGGGPAEEILNRAASSQADIIVVGGSGMRGVRGMLGSVSRNILGHCACSVLIGKAG